MTADKLTPLQRSILKVIAKLDPAWTLTVAARWRATAVARTEES